MLIEELERSADCVLPGYYQNGSDLVGTKRHLEGVICRDKSVYVIMGGSSGVPIEKFFEDWWYLGLYGVSTPISCKQLPQIKKFLDDNQSSYQILENPLECLKKDDENFQLYPVEKTPKRFSRQDFQENINERVSEITHNVVASTLDYLDSIFDDHRDEKVRTEFLISLECIIKDVVRKQLMRS